MTTTSGPRRFVAGSAASGLTAAILGLCVAGCVETGDFGRIKRHSVWNEVLETTGSLAASARSEPVSHFDFTDDERVLRDRAWRFLVPAHDRAVFDRALADLAAKRILPPGLTGSDTTAYHRALLSDGAVSPASRYRRLSEDAEADARLIPAMAEVAERVLTADGVRLRALDYARDISPADAESAFARTAENRCLLAWVKAGLLRRIAAYRYALEHLVVATPQGDAVPAERSLAFLSSTGTAFDRFDVPSLDSRACGGPGRAPRLPVAGPLVAKG